MSIYLLFLNGDTNLFIALYQEKLSNFVHISVNKCVVNKSHNNKAEFCAETASDY